MRVALLLPSIIASLLLVPSLALAHVPFEGFHNFYNGLLHPVFVPAHMMLILGVGAILGQGGLHHTQWALVVFWGAILLGLGLAWFWSPENLEITLLSFAAFAGGIMALARPLPLSLAVILCAGVGLFLGLDSIQESLQGAEKLVALLGSWVGISFFVLYPAILAGYSQKTTWSKLGLRVLGSWISAASLLVMALQLGS
jgi:hydrogenase/urease accessory protein HupE